MPTGQGYVLTYVHVMRIFTVTTSLIKNYCTLMKSNERVLSNRPGRRQ